MFVILVIYFILYLVLAEHSNSRKTYIDIFGRRLGKPIPPNAGRRLITFALACAG